MYRQTTFIHTADWQLGKPFAGIDDPLKRGRVQQERFDAVRRIGDVARRRQAEFVLVAGDLFDSPSPTNATIAAALAAIASIEIPVLAIPGNHDHGGPGSLWEQAFFRSEHARLAPNFRFLRDRVPEELDTAVILPCPLRRRHEPDDPTAWIRGLDFDALSDKPRIVLAHGGTSSFGAAGQEQRDDEENAVECAAGARNVMPNQITLERLPMAEIDYIALGDWHGTAQVGPKAGYSGTHETDRFPRHGQEPGNVTCVTVSRTGGNPVVHPVSTGRLQWISGTVSLDGCEASRLDEWLASATAEVGFGSTLARVRLVGGVSLAARAELDAVKESWSARLLRFDVDDQTTLIPSVAEIRELAERPGDPITAGVAADLAARLGSGAALDSADAAVIREALHLLHSQTLMASGETS